MIKTAQAVFVLAVLVCLGALALASGAPPLGAAALVAGGALLLLRANAIIDRGRIRRGKPETFSASFADLAQLTGREWAELALVVVVGAALFIGGAASSASGT